MSQPPHDNKTDSDDNQTRNMRVDKDPLNLQDHQEPFCNIAKMICKTFHVPYSIISVYDEQSKQVYSLKYTLNEKLVTFMSDELNLSMIGPILKTKEQVIIEDSSKNETYKDHPFMLVHKFSFLTGHPIYFGCDNDVIGAIFIGDIKPRYFAKEKLTILEDLSQWAKIQIEHIYKTNQDLKQKKELLKAQENNNLLNEALQHISSSVIITDPTQANNPISYVNKAFTKLTGYAAKEVIGKNCRFLQGEDTDPNTIDKIRCAMKAGENIEVEILNYKKDRTFFWNELQINPIKNAQGNITHFIGLQNDITSRKNAEQNRSKKLADQSNLLNAIPNVIIMIDKKGNILKWNKKFLDYVIEPKENYPFHMILKDLDQEGLRTTLSQVTHNHSLTVVDHLLGDEHSHPFTWTIGSLLNSDEEIYGYAAVGTDLTNEQNIEMEMMEAGNIQRKLLPQPFKSDHIQLETIYKPAQFVSGDSFGYTWKNRGTKLAIYLIDIMGHGMPSAINTSAVKLLFQQAVAQSSSLAEKLADVNTKTMDILSSDYFTAAMIVELDLRTGKLSYASAGMNKFIYQSSLETTIIKNPGTYLGLFEGATFTEHEITLQEGDHVHFATDGIIDLTSEDQLKSTNNFEEMMFHLQMVASEGSLQDDSSAVSLLYRKKLK
ncbi:SpoIIE family protein phosphatase [Salipaludibacillus sp. HK11]|uniref:SpoIIE family protein phosphatase n=1 Tax=Salipaludibacillus sp. HK11 TaxID=3394320 RepID=UPI0039FB9830